jgi:hypothetical protein
LISYSFKVGDRVVLGQAVLENLYRYKNWTPGKIYTVVAGPKGDSPIVYSDIPSDKLFTGFLHALSEHNDFFLRAPEAPTKRRGFR